MKTSYSTYAVNRTAARKAERAVAQLVGELGIDGAWRVFKEPLEKFAKKAWVDGRVKLKQKKPPFQVMQLKGRTFDHFDQTEPPGNDHAEMYLWNGKPTFYVYHPYDGVDEELLAAFCKKHGLGYDISPTSWHFLGRTLRVTLYDPERHKEWSKAKWG